MSKRMDVKRLAREVSNQLLPTYKKNIVEAIVSLEGENESPKQEEILVAQIEAQRQYIEEYVAELVSRVLDEVLDERLPK